MQKFTAVPKPPSRRSFLKMAGGATAWMLSPPARAQDDEFWEEYKTLGDLLDAIKDGLEPDDMEAGSLSRGVVLSAFEKDKALSKSDYLFARDPKTGLGIFVDLDRSHAGIYNLTTDTIPSMDNRIYSHCFQPNPITGLPINGPIIDEEITRDAARTAASTTQERSQEIIEPMRALNKERYTELLGKWRDAERKKNQANRPKAK